MSKFFHATVDISGCLSRSDSELDCLVVGDNGEPVSGAVLRSMLQQAQAVGWSVLPLCDNVDEIGECQGHQ